MGELNYNLVITTDKKICRMTRVGDADWDSENPIGTLNDIVTIAGGFMNSDDQYLFKLELEKLFMKV